MYVTVSASGKNKQNRYVLLMEVYTNKNGKSSTRILKNYGRLEDFTKDDPLAVQKLKAQYQEIRDSNKEAIAKANLLGLNDLMQKLQDAADDDDFIDLLYGHYALKALWEGNLKLHQHLKYLQKSTKFDFDLNKLISHIVFTKIINPRSIFGTFEEQDFYLGDPLKGIKLADCYNALEFINDYKDDIVKTVNRQLDKEFGKQRATICFYDVTNTYFESPLTDKEMGLFREGFLEILTDRANQARLKGEISNKYFDDNGNVIYDNIPDEFIKEVFGDQSPFFRMRGPSKEHRTDLPLASIVLVMDRNGFPLDWAVYEGNRSEYKSMKDTILKFKKNYKISNAIVVADRGLNSADNLQMLKDAGFGYVVAQKITQFNKNVKKAMLDLDSYSYIDPNKPEIGKYYLIEDWEKKGATGEAIKCSLVLTWNKKRYDRDVAILEGMLDNVRKNQKSGKPVQSRRPAWLSLAKKSNGSETIVTGIDEKAYKEKLSLCGFAAMVYDEVNSEDRIKNGPEIANLYHRLNAIEECFKILKSNIGLRPMYVRKEIRIGGHVTACMLALILLRLIQSKLENNNVHISVNDICASLTDATVRVFPMENKDDSVLYLRGGKGQALRKNNPYKSDNEIASEYIKNGKIQNKREIFKACGISLPPRVASRAQLATSLKTRFPKIENAMSHLALVKAGLRKERLQEEEAVQLG